MWTRCTTSGFTINLYVVKRIPPSGGGVEDADGDTSLWWASSHPACAIVSKLGEEVISRTAAHECVHFIWGQGDIIMHQKDPRMLMNPGGDLYIAS